MATLFFLGFDENGIPRHAHKRGLNSVGEAYRGNVESSDAAYSFKHMGASNRLYVFEAPIDMLSFIALYPKNWQRHSYVALCGVAEHAMLKCLELKPDICHIHLCLDNDERGQEAAGRLRSMLVDRGYPYAEVLTPRHKDWNEDLQAQAAGEAPMVHDAIVLDEPQMLMG